MPLIVVRGWVGYFRENTDISNLGEVWAACIQALLWGEQGRDTWAGYDISWKGYDIS
jgi:hypothetical protein